jgi:hypothetical protein
MKKSACFVETKVVTKLTAPLLEPVEYSLNDNSLNEGYPGKISRIKISARD